MSERYQERYHDTGISDEELIQQYTKEQEAKLEKVAIKYREDRAKVLAMVQDKANTAVASKRKSFVPLMIKTAILSLLAICGIVMICGSIYTIVEYFESSYYARHEEDIFVGVILFMLSVSILLLCIYKLPRAYKEIPVIYRQTSKYKEKCYKRIDKIHRYYERGSITKEEFESLKNEILNKIK